MGQADLHCQGEQGQCVLKLYKRFQFTAHCGLAKVIDKNLREKNNVEYAKYRWSEWAMSQRIP